MKDKYLLLDYLPLSMLPSEVGGEREREMEKEEEIFLGQLAR
jgi:hypothetical protein